MSGVYYEAFDQICIERDLYIVTDNDRERKRVSKVTQIIKAGSRHMERAKSEMHSNCKDADRVEPARRYVPIAGPT